MSKKAINKVNHDFFKEINNHDKAYWLGVMYSDGCIHNNARKHKNGNIYSQKSIKLTSKDKEFVENFCKSLGHSLPIKEVYPKSGFSTRNSHYVAFISSYKLFEDLENLGCIERKSLVLKFPNRSQVSEEFISSFLLGYFDGDGSVMVSKSRTSTYKRLSIMICGTKEFLEVYRSSLDFLNQEKCITKEKRRNSNTWRLRFDGRNAIKFYERIYGNSQCLARKKEIFDSFIKERGSTTIIEYPNG